MPKRFDELLHRVAVVDRAGDAGVAVSGIRHDSREILPGEVFVALPGLHSDGRAFIADAISRGAVAVVQQPPAFPVPDGIASVVVEDAARALGELANTFYGNPSAGMLMVGVTGTNGKTTITWILESIFREAGWSPGVIGTIACRFAGRSEPALHTTPFADDLIRLLAQMRDAGVTAVAMEVSSHALVQGRVREVDYDVAAFTNLTPDHLDFHGTMESYFEAKSTLFTMMQPARRKAGMPPGAGARTCVVNVDDPWGARLVRRCPDGTVLRVGDAGDIRWDTIRSSVTGTHLVLRDQGEQILVSLPLIGAYNQCNAAIAYAIARSQGISPAVIARGMECMPAVPGRLERVADAPVSVIIDYAHTPDALEKVITAVRDITPVGRRITVVFGCGGDRDRSKRPVMGAVATKLADRVIVTSDNPRSEDPAAILVDIEVGIRRSGATNYCIEPDRAAAIRRAIRESREGDVVLLAGKGHETYQILASGRVHFDEREIVREVMASR